MLNILKVVVTWMLNVLKMKFSWKRHIMHRFFRWAKNRVWWSMIHSNVFLHIKIILHINFYLWSPNRICQISIFQLQWCKLVWKIKHLFKPNIFTQNGRTTLDNYYDMQGSNLLKCYRFWLKACLWFSMVAIAVVSPYFQLVTHPRLIMEITDLIYSKNDFFFFFPSFQQNRNSSLSLIMDFFLTNSKAI